MHIVLAVRRIHAGLVGKYVIEKLARIPVETDVASEYRYRSPIITEDTLVIVVSQSGETADTWQHFVKRNVVAHTCWRLRML